MYKLRIAAVVSSCLLPFCWLPAKAAVTFSSGAYDTSVHISAGSTVVADASTGAIAGSTAPAYNLSGGQASVNQSFTLASGTLGTAKEGLQTGLVSTSASSGASSATGSASLANVSSQLTNQLLGDLLPTVNFGLGASAISSTTTVGIDANGLFGTGSSSLAGLTLSGTALGSLSIDGSLYANPAANTVLLSLAGLKVILNEQLSTASAGGLSMQTNAVHIALTNYSLAGSLLTGDIILGHSEAAVSGVPEPATWGMMLVGFGLIGAASRRRRVSLTFA